MNKKQWNVLSIVFILLIIFFIFLDRLYALDVEIYEPFIYLFFALGIVFMICS